MGKVVCIIQAHTTSTRLPNKIFMELGGKSMLYNMVNRVSKANNVDEIVIATTVEKEDDPVEKFCIDNNIKYFRGSDKNVLSRYYETAIKFKADIIVRITSDCPLIEPEIIDDVIEFFCENRYDYVSPSSDLGLIRGLDTEVFSFKALNLAVNTAKDASELEHVTLCMYKNTNMFKVGRPNVKECYKNKSLRLCVDEKKDYILIKHIYDKFYSEGDIVDTKTVINYLNKEINIRKINAEVKQKKV